MLNPPSVDINELSVNVLFDISNNTPSIVVSNNSQGSGLSNVDWWFDVHSPNGNPIHTGSSVTPDISGIWSTFTMSDDWGIIEWSGAPYLFKLYARDSSGYVYTQEYSAVICRPAGNSAKNVNRFGRSITDVTTKCDQARVFFQNKTNSSYKGLDGTLVASVLKMIYPIDETDNIPTPFTATGFTNALVPISYPSDNYQFVAYQVYDYALSDSVTVRIKYYQKETFPVYCNIDTFPLACEFDKLIERSRKEGCNPSSDVGKMVTVINGKMALMYLGMLKPLSGINVPKIIKEIEEIGEFDCDCCSIANTGGIVANTSSIIDGYNFTVTNSGGDVIGSFAGSSGPNIVLELYDKSYVFGISQATNDWTNAFTVMPSILGNTKTFLLNVNPVSFAYDLAGQIQNDAATYNLWLSLFGAGQANKIVVDGKCVFNSGSACDYVFTLENIPASGTFAIFSGLEISGVNNPSNHNFNLATLPGLQTYLNGLGKGTFVVTDMTGGVIEIATNANPNNITGINYKVGGTSYIADMQRTCGSFVPVSLDEFAANIINYLCDLSTSQMATSDSFTIQWIDGNGVIQNTEVPAGVTLTDFINELLQDAGKTINYIKNLGAANCGAMQGLYKQNAGTPISSTSVLHGVKGGKCSNFSFLDVFNYMLTAGISDNTTIQNFCDFVSKCVSGNTCAGFSYIDYVMTDYDASCVEATGIIYSVSYSGGVATLTINTIVYGNNAGGSQTWTIEYKEWNDGGGFIQATNSAVASISGNINTPVVIVGLSAGMKYHVRVSNNCSSPTEYYIQEIQL